MTGTSTTKDISPRITLNRRKSRRFWQTIQSTSRRERTHGVERRASLELGHTNAGRVLFVAWTPRGKLRRPVTAFDANRKTRAAYQRRRNEERQQEHN
jgi:uncharacterized DUF497 family protein